MDIIDILSYEYIETIKWLKPRLNDYRKLDNIDRIVFFNIWVISYYVFRFNNQKYTHTQNSVSDFIKNIDDILEEDKYFIKKRLFLNLDFRFNKERYELCLKLLRRTKYDKYFLKMVDYYLLDEKYNNDVYNINILIIGNIEKKYIK